MAEEITISVSVTVRNGELVLSTPSTAVISDQTTARAATFTVDVATSETTVDFGDITPGLVMLKNLDATNFTDWTTDTGDYNHTLDPNGDTALFRLKGTQTLFLKADTAPTKVQVTLVNT